MQLGGQTTVRACFPAASGGQWATTVSTFEKEGAQAFVPR